MSVWDAVVGQTVVPELRRTVDDANAVLAGDSTAGGAMTMRGCLPALRLRTIRRRARSPRRWNARTAAAAPVPNAATSATAHTQTSRTSSPTGCRSRSNRSATWCPAQLYGHPGAAGRSWSSRTPTGSARMPRTPSCSRSRSHRRARSGCSARRPRRTSSRRSGPDAGWCRCGLRHMPRLPRTWSGPWALIPTSRHSRRGRPRGTLGGPGARHRRGRPGLATGRPAAALRPGRPADLPGSRRPVGRDGQGGCGATLR